MTSYYSFGLTTKEDYEEEFKNRFYNNRPKILKFYKQHNMEHFLKFINHPKYKQPIVHPNDILKHAKKYFPESDSDDLKLFKVHIMILVNIIIIDCLTNIKPLDNFYEEITLYDLAQKYNRTYITEYLTKLKC
jgi:hypothetical protein